MHDNIAAARMRPESTMTETALVKLGGSVITWKDRVTTFSRKGTDALSGEISRYLGASPGRRVVVVHGGGSFGHVKAKRYSLSEGMRDSSQVPGFAEVRNDMRKLNLMVVTSLLGRGVSAVSIPAEGILGVSGAHVSSEDFSLVDMALEKNFVPVTFGDAVFDAALGFTILSGDKLMLALSRHLHPDVSVFCTDVDGVFDSNPAVDREAHLIRHLTPSSTISTSSSSRADVTGEMAGKLAVLFEIGRNSGRTAVINGRVKGRLLSALSGRTTVGTEVLP